MPAALSADPSNIIKPAGLPPFAHAAIRHAVRAGTIKATGDRAQDEAAVMSHYDEIIADYQLHRLHELELAA